jgi:fatty acid synthase subunit alpha
MALNMETAKRLGSQAEAKSYLDSVVQTYGKHSDITLSQGGAAGAAGGSAGGAMINLEEFEKFQQSHDDFVSQQLEVLLQYLKRDLRDGYRLHDLKHSDYMRVQDELDSIQKEHGENYLEVIQPVFDPLKARHFDSAWDCVRQTAFEMFFNMSVSLSLSQNFYFFSCS